MQFPLQSGCLLSDLVGSPQFLKSKSHRPASLKLYMANLISNFWVLHQAGVVYNSLNLEHVQVTQWGHLAISNFENIRHVCFSTDDLMILVMVRFLEEYGWDLVTQNDLKGKIFRGSALEIHFKARNRNMGLIQFSEQLMVLPEIENEYPLDHSAHIISKIMGGKFRPFGNLRTQAFCEMKIERKDVNSFIAPEILIQQKCSYASDFWSLGMIFFRFFYSANLFEILDKNSNFNMLDYEKTLVHFENLKYKYKKFTRMTEEEKCLFYSLTCKDPLRRLDLVQFPRLRTGKYLKNVLFRKILKEEYAFKPELEFDAEGQEIMVITGSKFSQNVDFFQKVKFGGFLSFQGSLKVIKEVSRGRIERRDLGQQLKPPIK